VKLNRKVEDLEDVRALVGGLTEVREKEADVEALIAPIEDMYGLLLRYEVRGGGWAGGGGGMGAACCCVTR
jgi:dynein heavy chain